MLDVLSPSLPPTTYSLFSITATPNCSRRPFMTPAWTHVLVRRSYFSMVVEPGVTNAIKHLRVADAGGWTAAASGCHTFSGVHPSYGVQHAHRGLSGFGPRALEHGTPLRQKMVLHGLHQQLLAFQIIREHLVVFQIGKELQIQGKHTLEKDFFSKSCCSSQIVPQISLVPFLCCCVLYVDNSHKLEKCCSSQLMYNTAHNKKTKSSETIRNMNCGCKKTNNADISLIHHWNIWKLLKSFSWFSQDQLALFVCCLDTAFGFPASWLKSICLLPLSCSININWIWLIQVQGIFANTISQLPVIYIQSNTNPA